MTIHICAPLPIDKKIITGVCLDCKKRTRFLSFYYEWYGADQTCLRCGRRWSDGEWVGLPSTRYARKESIAAAKKEWRRRA